jgi:hypothetical protein
VAHSSNEGIVQSGGTMTATNIAVGRGASINQTEPADSDALAEVRRQLDSILNELNRHESGIQNFDEVKESVQFMQEELAKETPNRLTLRSVLSGIADSVKSVSAIATTVEGLKMALSTLFG